jgi:hypothetical protein
MSSRVLRFTPEQHADYERRRAQAIGVGNAELVTIMSGGVESRHAGPTSTHPIPQWRGVQCHRTEISHSGIGRVTPDLPTISAGVAPGPLTPAKPRSIPMPESLVVKAVLAALELHAGVAWAQRMNVVSQRIDQRYVRAGFVGLSDIIGQMMDGRFLAIECKSAKGRLTDDQAAFLDTVRRHGGVAFMARAVEDVWRELAL